MYQAPASGDRCGKVQVIDIGIPKAAQEAVQLELLTSRWATRLASGPAGRREQGRPSGRLLVVGGNAATSARPGSRPRRLPGRARGW